MSHNQALDSCRPDRLSGRPEHRCDYREYSAQQRLARPGPGLCWMAGVVKHGWTWAGVKRIARCSGAGRAAAARSVRTLGQSRGMLVLV